MTNAKTVTRFDPTRDLVGLTDEVERVFRHVLGGQDTPVAAGAWSPALDVEENEDAFVLHVELPGMKADDVDISLEENVLTISGERTFYADRERDGFKRVERRFGRFHRAVRLPDRVEPDGVTAAYRDGIVSVTVPKAPEAKPRRIQIETQ